MLPLFKHQEASIEWMRGKPAVFDASDPGTGKTRVEVEIARARIKADGRAVLVVAPKSLLRSAWRDDFLKFAPELITSCAYAENRDKAFSAPADVYITNTDGANWLGAQPAKFFRRFSTLIVDESGAFKHATSKRSRSLRKIAPLFDFRANLNGTVNPNTILDVWHQYFLLDAGQRLGKSFFHFRNSVCRPLQVGPMPNMVKWEDREGAEAVVASCVRDITIRHLFEDCLDIPPNHEYTVKFVMNAKHRRAYNEMKALAKTQLETGTVTAINASAVATKLLQIASGAVYQDEHTYHAIDESRNELVMDLLEERKHSLVFFNWKHQKDQLLEAAKKRGFTFCVLDGEVSDAQKVENVRLFEAGFFKICFAHPQSAAHGLTLVRATTTIWTSPTYNLEHFIQGNKRIHRAGQTHKTETIVILAESTLDERAYAALAAKELHMIALLGEL
jgi:SNF2 family DNA or RNA helicase